MLVSIEFDEKDLFLVVTTFGKRTTNSVLKLLNATRHVTAISEKVIHFPAWRSPNIMRHDPLDNLRSESVFIKPAQIETAMNHTPKQTGEEPRDVRPNLIFHLCPRKTKCGDHARVRDR